MGENGKKTQIIKGVLDSGADEVTIPKKIADYLELTLLPREKKILTAGGIREAYKSTVTFYLGRGGREVEYKDVEICVIDNKDVPVLVGIVPVFMDYDVIIQAYRNRVILEPKKEKDK